jgi:hypothetical protein
MAAIDFKTFLSVAPHVLDARFPIILRGRHGIGKSEIVYQIEKELSFTGGVVERRASQMTEGDLIGLPSISGGTTKWNPPDWFNQACQSGVLLFLDEIDRATPEVRQGIFELTDSRKINGHQLHQNTVIVAAVNGGENSSDYQVGEMDPAELDRYTVFDVEPTVEDWLHWADSKVEGVIWDFINESRNHLEHENGNYEPGKIYPSRRSWARLSQTLSGIREEFDGAMLFSIAQGFVGFEAAISFRDFYLNHDRMVSIEDIINDGNVELTKDFDINKHGALIEKMEASKIFDTSVLTEPQLNNLATYFITVPGEMAMKLFSIIGRCANRDNIINFHGTEIDGKRIGDHIVSLVQKIPE